MKISDRGLEIIKSCDPDSEINVGHDQIYVGDFESLQKKMSEVEIKEMKAMDWFEDAGCYSHFL